MKPWVPAVVIAFVFSCLMVVATIKAEIESIDDSQILFRFAVDGISYTKFKQLDGTCLQGKYRDAITLVCWKE